MSISMSIILGRKITIGTKNYWTEEIVELSRASLA